MAKQTADGAPSAKKNGGRRVTRSLDKSLACAFCFCRSEIPLSNSNTRSRCHLTVPMQCLSVVFIGVAGA
jgi:hypothetical protein